MTNDAKQILREGIVSAIFAERHTARVTFGDKDDLVSDELPVLTLCSSGNKFYSLPDVGTSVVCLFAPNAEGTGTGFIIGSRFHDKSKPNADSVDKTRMDFSDNTFVEYDRSSHKLKIKCSGDVEIEADGKITFTGKDEIEFAGSKNLTFNATENVNITATKQAVVRGEQILLN